MDHGALPGDGRQGFTGIKNDPNQWSEDPRYIVDLLKRIVRVSLESVRIVKALPALKVCGVDDDASGTAGDVVSGALTIWRSTSQPSRTFVTRSRESSDLRRMDLLEDAQYSLLAGAWHPSFQSCHQRCLLMISFVSKLWLEGTVGG